MQAITFVICVLGASAQMNVGGKLGSFLNMDSQVTFASVQQSELAQIKQDPCAGCSDPHVVQHQKCMVSMSNNPCTKQYTGVAFDNQCCVVKEKHGRCLTCKSQGARPHYNSKWTDQANLGVTVDEP